MSDDTTSFWRERAASLGECQAALATAERQLLALNDHYLRAVAANENIRKQAERETAQVIQERLTAFALRLLDVADNLERALAYTPPDNPLRSGVQATLKQLQAALAQEGIKPLVVEVGALFDPHRHEAISAQPADVNEEVVTDIFQTGYMFDRQLLRPARVMVATPRSTAVQQRRSRE